MRTAFVVRIIVGLALMSACGSEEPTPANLLDGQGQSSEIMSALELDSVRTRLVLLRQHDVPSASMRLSRSARPLTRTEKERGIARHQRQVSQSIGEFAKTHAITSRREFVTALSGLVVDLSDEDVERLSKDPRVDAIFDDEIYFVPQAEAALQTFACSSLAPYHIENAVSFVGGPNNRAGDDEFIWIIDSGIADHSDLNIVGAPYAAGISSPDTSDTYGHGTMVAGVAAAKYNTY
jgi:hypothetical protein